jgi:hypothetical protein
MSVKPYRFGDTSDGRLISGHLALASTHRVDRYRQMVT